MANYKDRREQVHARKSAARLTNNLKKKIQTTMIGALSSIEKHFGFLWGHESPDALTPEQEHMKELYDLVRSEILDRGNNQCRNLETEFMNYDITWLRYKITLPVKPLSTLEGDESNGESKE